MNVKENINNSVRLVEKFTVPRPLNAQNSIKLYQLTKSPF